MTASEAVTNCCQIQISKFKCVVGYLAEAIQFGIEAGNKNKERGDQGCIVVVVQANYCSAKGSIEQRVWMVSTFFSWPT